MSVKEVLKEEAGGWGEGLDLVEGRLNGKAGSGQREGLSDWRAMTSPN